MELYAIRALVLVIFLTFPGFLQAKSVADFEASEFYKGETLVSKESPRPLGTGGMYHSYSFRDPNNPYSSYGASLVVVQGEVAEVGLVWHGKSTYMPARLTPERAEQLKRIALFLEAPDQAIPLLRYVDVNQHSNYDGGSNVAGSKELGKLKVKAGSTGGGLWVEIKPPSAAAAKLKRATLDPVAVSKVVVGTPAGQVMELLGQPKHISKLGTMRRASWRNGAILG